MKRVFIIVSAAFSFAIALPTAFSKGEPNSAAMIFLPPGASYCRDFLHLEPMQKYDSGTTPVREKEAEDYFTYRGTEEWVRGFATAANILNAKNGSGDATRGRSLRTDAAIVRILPFASRRYLFGRGHAAFVLFTRIREQMN
jgi:hypothetical protein